MRRIKCIPHFCATGEQYGNDATGAQVQQCGSHIRGSPVFCMVFGLALLTLALSLWVLGVCICMRRERIGNQIQEVELNYFGYSHHSVFPHVESLMVNLDLHSVNAANDPGGRKGPTSDCPNPPRILCATGRPRPRLPHSPR